MRKKLGEILVAAGSVTREDIEDALVDQRSGEPARLGDLLVALGKITPLQLALALSEQYGVPFTELPAVPAAILDSVPMELQRQFRFVPVKREGTTVTIAMADLSLVAEVQPLLKKQFTRVNVLVAASDEIDAVHAALSGEYDAPPSPVQLPQIAPVIAPVVPPTANARPAAHAPTVDELFGSMGLDEAASRPSSPGFEINVEEEAPRRPPEEEPFFFEAQPIPAISSDSVTVEVIEEEEEEEEEAASEPVRTAELLAAAELLDAPPVSTDPVPFESEADERPTSQKPALGEDAPFFDAAPASAPVKAVADDAFVPDVPPSSPSSLATLVIETEVPVIPTVSRAILTPAPRPQQQKPVSLAPVTPEPAALPEWLKTEAPAASEWTGALDHLAPSKLILAVTRALLRRGVLTEQDILDADAKK